MIPNVTTLALIWIGGSLLLLPLLIVTVRLAVIPLVEALTRPRHAGAAESRLARLEESVGRMGQELEQLSAAARTRRTA